MALYIVATPIGNLKDITARAVETLRAVPVVIVEKWTDSIKLLNHFAIKPEQILHYDENDKKRVTAKILEILKTQDAAYITSSGTPGLSDPGADLVRQCRENSIPVIPVPGPAALAAAISVCGFRGPFLFIDFLPRKTGHILKYFQIAKDNEFCLAYFDSPYRLEKNLEILAQFAPAANIFLGKEMTKKFESYSIQKARDILDRLAKDKNFGKGEFTVIVQFVK